MIYLNPPIEDCRYKLYQEMFAWKMVVLSLPRIQSQRYQVGYFLYIYQVSFNISKHYMHADSRTKNKMSNTFG